MPPQGRGGGSPAAPKSAALADPTKHPSVLQMKKAAIERIREQNAKLKEEVLLENKFCVRSSNQETIALANKLQDEIDQVARMTSLEMTKIQMLEQQEQELSQHLTSTRSNMGSISAAREQSQAAQKQITLLENRLDKCFIRYNEAVTHNKQLRAQIDGLRRERLMFEALDATLQKELGKIKEEMAAKINQTKEMHGLKEGVIAQIAVTKGLMEKEQTTFEDEWRGLTEIIERDATAQTEARQREMAERERKTQELLRNRDGLGQTEKKKKQAKQLWAGGRSDATSLSEERLKHYENACNTVLEKTRPMDPKDPSKLKEPWTMEDLLSAFAAAEDEAYTLFTYVNDVNAEIEKLEDQITAGQAEVQEAMQQGEAWDTMQRTTASCEAEAMQRTMGHSRSYEHRCAAVSAVLTSLRDPIWDLFNRLGCNTSTVKELLGGDDVDETNIMAYLGIIEQRANELLKAHAATEGSDESEQLRMLACTNGLPADRRIIIELPTTRDKDQAQQEQQADGSGAPPEEPEQEADMPLTRAALQERIQRSLATKIDTMIKVRPMAPDAAKKPAAKSGK